MIAQHAAVPRNESGGLRNLFAFRGRLRRLLFARGCLAALVTLTLFTVLLDQLVLPTALVIAIYGVVVLRIASLAARRWHDLNKTSLWLALPLIPLLGPVWATIELLFRRGTHGANRFGADPRTAGLDYQSVPTAALATDARATVVNDVTGLNEVSVLAISAPQSVDEVIAALRNHSGAVSIGGGHFSMGGQTASAGSLHLDLRRLNRILWFSPADRRIRVEAGVRWCDIQKFVDPHDFSIRIMQTYANFTVGGSLSVNCHGRYVGQGPLVLAVESIRLVMADGTVTNASRSENSELFFGAIGGYGALGVIVEAVLHLADNSRVERISHKLPVTAYRAHFSQVLHGAKRPVFHNADIFPPHYRRLRSVTWYETQRPPTEPERLMPLKRSYWLHRYLFWAFTETPLGKWRREFVIEPLEYLTRRVHYRNYEAGYNVAELEPTSRSARTYVLQEYFVPVARFEEFLDKAREILQRHRVNVVNISIRHAEADPGTLLAWAREEVFAFVLYYKQRTRENAKARVAVWTRELIDAVVSVEGTYYLPYQPHATAQQFHKAYPDAEKFFALKRRVDPNYRFRNALWDRYLPPPVDSPEAKDAAVPPNGGRSTVEARSAAVSSGRSSEFRAVFSSTEASDAFYLFLQNVFHLYPEDRFHTLLQETSLTEADDERIYRRVQAKLPSLKPLGAELSHALPALAKQKEVMTEQTLQILGERRAFEGYLEIGTTGRYVSQLKDRLTLTGSIILLHERPATHSPADVVERGQLTKLGRFVPLRGYAPIAEEDVATASVDLVTCYIGLHHATPEQLDPFVESLARVLRPGGVFVLRDHDVADEAMRVFVSLVHTVFNLGSDESWENNAAEPRFFAPLTHWTNVAKRHGLDDLGHRLLQDHDPSLNTLLGFEKVR